jgi:hypothetical protein
VRGGPAGVVGGAPAPAGQWGGGGDFDPPASDQSGGGGDFGDMLLGEGGGNTNPNPVEPAPQGGQQVGQVQIPFGQAPASSVEGHTQNLITKLGAGNPADANNPNSSPPDEWYSLSNILGDMIARSIGVGGGQADADQKAAASGIEADIELGRQEGAGWIAAYDGGVVISETEGGTGNLAADLQLARAAYECGATLAPCTREFLGLPPEPASAPGGASGTELGADPGSTVTALAGAIAVNAANAANVGAAKSVQQMSNLVFDVGLIYPICDFTPIIWMQ